MQWELSWRADPRARELADRHYNRQKVGASGFVPPGRCLVLYAKQQAGEAFWVTSWPLAEYTLHAWAGAWVCSAFRNEGAGLSSDLILSAVAATRWKWEPPPLGMITFVDPGKVRRKRDPGRCYRRAGFVEVGRTKVNNLIALQLTPDKMPPPAQPIGTTIDLFSAVGVTR
jgi:hypothetical protein